MASSAAAWDAMEDERRLTDRESVRVSVCELCSRLCEAEAWLGVAWLVVEVSQRSCGVYGSLGM